MRDGEARNPHDTTCCFFSFKAVFSASGVGLGLEWAIEIEHLGLFYVGNSKWSSWC